MNVCHCLPNSHAYQKAQGSIGKFCCWMFANRSSHYLILFLFHLLFYSPTGIYIEPFGKGFYIYIYIYIYMCVCVCVCAYEPSPSRTDRIRHRVNFLVGFNGLEYKVFLLLDWLPHHGYLYKDQTQYILVRLQQILKFRFLVKKPSEFDFYIFLPNLSAMNRM